MKKELERLQLEVISYLGQRNFFGAPYLDKEKFKSDLGILAGIALSDHNDGPDKSKDDYFSFEYKDLGFSRRMRVSFLFCVHPNDKLELARMRFFLEDVQKEIVVTKPQMDTVHTLKEIEDTLVIDHKKRVAGKIDRKHLRGS